MSTAIVILNWNGKNFLQKFLKILTNCSIYPDTRIIIADNASTDSSLEFLSSNFPNIETIILDKNYGFAGGYNKALSMIEADYFVLLNSDVEVSENWLEPLIKCLDQNKHIAACQPKILSHSNRSNFEHAGAAGGFIDMFGFPFCRGRVLANVEKDEGQYNEKTEIFWASGACMVIRSDVFKKVGGFDDEFFAHMEEIDLCWRIKSRGYGILYVPESKVFHIGGGTLSVENPLKTYLNFRNNLLMLFKNLPENRLSKIMFWRKIFDYSAAFQLLITARPKNALSVIKARKDYKKMLVNFGVKRQENLDSAVYKYPTEILQKSIVLNFYLKGKKTYNLLIKK